MTLRQNASVEKTIEKTAKTIDEAIEQVLSEWDVPRERIEYKILEQPAKGLFGIIGTKPAKIQISLLSVDPVAVAKDFLQSIFSALKLSPSLEISTHGECLQADEQDAYSESDAGKNKDYVLINIRGYNLGILIGKHGQTLDALQYLTNITASRKSSKKTRFILDVEGYRNRREESLTKLAFRLADKVKTRREKVVLEPMNAQERKIIHIALQDDGRIMTYSEGEDPFRRVVIAPKK